MPDPSPPMSFSFEAEQGKTSAVKKIHALQQQTLVDNWYSIFPEDKDQLTLERAQRKYHELTHPPADEKGIKQKYIRMPGGKFLATADTIQEYGNNFAASVDEGTSVGISMFGGNSWLGKLLNKLWTAIRALFDWIGGKASSFTEAYANITANDIAQSFDSKMQAMGKDQEHAQFMQQTGLIEQGKAAIVQEVYAEAHLPGVATAEPDFNLEQYIAVKAPKPPVRKEYTPPAGADSKDVIAGAITAAVTNTKNAIPGGEASLEPEQVKQLKELEEKLVENGKAIVAAPDAPQNAAEFSERAIRRTAADVKISLGDNTDKLPFGQVIDALKGSNKPEQAQYGFLLSVLHEELQEAYDNVKNTIGAKAQPAAGKLPEPGRTDTDKPGELAGADEQKAADTKRTKATKDLEKLKKRAEDMETLITTTATDAVRNGIRDEVVDGVIDSYNKAGRLKRAAFFGGVENEIIAINELRKPGADETSLKDQKDKLYTFAYASGYALHPDQVDKIALITENAARTVIADPNNNHRNIGQDQMARKIQLAVYSDLKATKDDIAKLGTYEIGKYTKKNEKTGKDESADLLAAIADKIYDSISQDKNGIYKKLTGAQDVILKAAAAEAAEKSPKVSNPGIKRDPSVPDPNTVGDKTQPLTSPPPGRTADRLMPSPR